MKLSLKSLCRSLSALALVLCTTLSLHCGGEQAAAPVADSVLLALSPSNPQIAMGTAQQFSLRALADDGRTHELAAQAQWTLQDESGGSTEMAAGGLIPIERPGRYVVTARFAGRQVETPISVTTATLTAVALSPRTPSVAKGSTLAFKAVATFSDGTTQDVTTLGTWSVKDITGVGVATIDTTGTLQARAVGSTRITVRYQTRSSWTTVDVTAAKLTQIAVSPVAPTIAVGTNLRFTATGSYSDGSTADISSQVTWSVSDVMGTGVASIDGTGTANGQKQGQAKIAAELDSVTGEALLTVGPGVPVRIYLSTAPSQAPKGTTARFVATAALSDGSTQDVSSLATWSAADVVGTAVAAVDATGLVTGNHIGKATITATLRGLSAAAVFEVTPAVVTALEITPESLTLHPLQTSTLRVNAIYSDGSRQDFSATASWTSADVMGTDILTAAAGGKLSAKNVGTARVTAAWSGLSASAIVQVTPGTITKVSIDGLGFILITFSPYQFTATATFADGGTADVTSLATWTVSVKTGTPADWACDQGLLTAKSHGDVLVTASYMGFSGVVEVIRL